MKDILETIILNLVDNKEAVEIKELDGEKSIVFEVKAQFRYEYRFLSKPMY